MKGPGASSRCDHVALLSCAEGLNALIRIHGTVQKYTV